MLGVNSILTLGFVALGSAAPLSSRQVVPNYPPTQQSKGFRLIANVTDPSTDLDPPVNACVFTGYHTGARFNEAVATDDVEGGLIFYQNGTAEEIRYNRGDTISDGGSPPFPWGIIVEEQGGYDDGSKEASVSVNAGGGTPGVELTIFPEPYSYLTGTAPGTYAICPREIPYYNQVFNVIRWTNDVFNNDTAQYEHTVPEDCVAVRFLPQCAELPELPEGSQSSHEFAADSRCYEDVSAIDWSQHGP